MKGIASQQRKVARPALMPIALVAAGQAAQRVAQASDASVAASDAGDLTAEVNSIKSRLDGAGIP